MGNVAEFPVKRIKLEFIKSNVAGFDNIIKLNFVRNPGVTGPISLIQIRKIIIDKENISIFDDYEQLMQYMSNSVYMSESIYMGGLEILEGYAKDTATLTINETRDVKDFRFLLDYSIDEDDIVMYSLQYTYYGKTYRTPFVISYKPIKSKEFGEPFVRPCITRRNLRYRGPNENEKYNDIHKETYCDTRRLTEVQDSTLDLVDEATIESDNQLNILYNIMSQVDMYKSTI